MSIVVRLIFDYLINLIILKHTINQVSKNTRYNLHYHARLSVAPMMDWTDRHCRFMHRLMSANTLLYTEMVTAPAVIHGDRDRLLGFDKTEHPVALQLGGSDPAQLAQATAVATEYGYDEVTSTVVVHRIACSQGPLGPS